MFDYVPDVFRKQYADTEEEADRWYNDPDNNRRPPELLPRDEVARAINSEVKAGRGTPAGGVYLDVSTRMPAETITRRLPSMYHQFKELADVDITKEAMEVGPTCHYVMGGVEVDPDTAAAFGRVQGLFAAGEVSGGMHGSNRLGGNSLSDLLVFGKRAGEHAASYVDALTKRPKIATADVEAAVSTALAPLERPTGENPYTLQQDLQAVMGDLVGIIRREAELTDALKRLQELKLRVGNVGAAGGRRYNPGWHLALDLRNMLVVSECTAKAALEREESRGGHTREDFPAMDPQWRKVNLVCSVDESHDVHLERKPLPTMRPELIELFDRSELSKYMTEGELAEFGVSVETEAK
jgi:succinate dehydrogenase / fumarate reductase flavoprotein subunit